MPAEDVGGYDPVIHEGVEHLFPINDGAHTPLSTCPCDPLRAVNVRGGSGLPTWLHRVMAPPL